MSSMDTTLRLQIQVSKTGISMLGGRDLGARKVQTNLLQSHPRLERSPHILCSISLNQMVVLSSPSTMQPKVTPNPHVIELKSCLV